MFYLYASRPSLATDSEPESRAFAYLTTVTAVTLWLTVIAGTYIVLPPYRATPPPGTTDLSQFPRAFVLADGNTAWLHAFAMELKEHMPWIASMLTTAVGFIAIRYPWTTLRNPSLRTTTLSLLAISFAIVSLVSLLGVFVNKVAPLQ